MKRGTVRLVRVAVPAAGLLALCVMWAAKESRRRIHDLLSGTPNPPPEQNPPTYSVR